VGRAYPYHVQHKLSPNPRCHIALDMCHNMFTFSFHTLQKGHAYDAQNREVGLGGEDKQEQVRKARNALELYRVIG
jgi:hypothetical protein